MLAVGPRLECIDIGGMDPPASQRDTASLSSDDESVLDSVPRSRSPPSAQAESAAATLVGVQMAAGRLAKVSTTAQEAPHSDSPRGGPAASHIPEQTLSSKPQARFAHSTTLHTADA